jgi:hypothetical protein
VLARALHSPKVACSFYGQSISSGLWLCSSPQKMHYAGGAPNDDLGNWILQSLSMCGTLQSRGKSDGSSVTMAEPSDVSSFTSTIMILGWSADSQFPAGGPSAIKAQNSQNNGTAQGTPEIRIYSRQYMFLHNQPRLRSRDAGKECACYEDQATTEAEGRVTR